MYSTCLFCHANLGANESIEHFPIGRRLAFDPAKGRLWVVCRKCERWNLTPLEERWEAIEECERFFTATRLRTSTDNVGLARLKEGLELVRIGAPLRPEMAAWRYGDQFGRRRRKHLVWTGAGIAAAVGLIVVGPATGIIAGGGWGMYNVVNTGFTMYQQRRVRARLDLPDRPKPVVLRSHHLHRAAIVPAETGWGLRVSYEIPSDIRPRPVRFWKYESPTAHAARIEGYITLEGDEAMRMAGRLLPQLNAAGAKPDQVRSAVGLIEDARAPGALFERYAGKPISPYRRYAKDLPPEGHTLAGMTAEVRLAMEMASHEDSERAAMGGELALLEAAWRQAEEIAAIADDMFVDEERRKIEEMKRR